MGDVQVTLHIEVNLPDGTKANDTKTMVRPETGAPNHEFDPQFLFRQLFVECETQLLYGKYRLPLPDASQLTEQNISYSGTFTPDDFPAWENTEKVWREITNLLLEVEHMMAQARAFKDLEPTSSAIEVWYGPHASKIHALNEAAIRLSKIDDLFLVLLFVNSERTLLLDVDVSKPNWERKLNRKEIRRRLSLRQRPVAGVAKANRLARWIQRLRERFRKPETIPYLDNLSDREYATLLDVFSQFFGNQSAQKIGEYRDKIAHRFQPAVDHGDLYSELQFPTVRPTASGKGKVKVYTVKASSASSVQYTTEQLYDLMRDAVEHYFRLLLRLKTSVSTFAVA